MSNQLKTPIKIILTGGGSGGHITPILSVAQEIKKRRPDSKLIYIGQKGDSLASTILDTKLIDEFHYIRAGKWRRYHGESMWSHLKDIKTIYLNLKDVINLIIGIKQAWWLLLRIKPKVIFVKGGFVGLPVGISAKIRGIAFITHDSDAIPGLTNKIIGRWATYNAVGMPAELYNYPKKKTIYTGVPVNQSFTFVDQKQKELYRKQLGLNVDDEVVFVVGGGLGAQRLNDRLLDIARDLLADRPKLNILHITGKANFDSVSNAYKNSLSSQILQQVKIVDFTNQLDVYSGSADVVVMRAGATNLAEMAIQSKACILVPNPQLTGGHQLKNVRYWMSSKSVMVYDEADPADQLKSSIVNLLDNDEIRSRLETTINKLAKPEASTEIANILVNLTYAK